MAIDPNVLSDATQTLTTNGQTLAYVWQIVISVISGALGGFAVVAFRLGRYAEKIDQLEKCDIQRRLSTLEGSYAGGAASITKRKSPISLNEKGLALLEASGAKQFVQDNKVSLIAKIRELGHSTAYDVQENAKKAIASLKDDANFVPLKQYAFREGIELELIELAAALCLRDTALSDFGFSLTDVDVSSPVS